MARIEASAMFTTVLEACPSFKPLWEAFLAEWEPEPCPLPLYLALGELAQHVVGLLESGNVDEPKGIFKVVEVWLLDGDSFVREAAIVGFLEDLGNLVHESVLGVEDIKEHLGSESRRWWKKLDAFWAGDASALRDETEH